MRALLLLLILSALAVLALDPECNYQCDDPVWAATCTPRCNATKCEFNPPCGHEVVSEIRCPEDASPMDSCPQCETVVPAASIPTACLSSIVLCEETDCVWDCVDDAEVKYVRCKRQCEQPACAFQGVVSAARRFDLF